MRNPSDPPKMAIWNDGETMAALPEMRRGGGTVAWVEVVGRIRQPNATSASTRPRCLSPPTEALLSQNKQGGNDPRPDPHL